MGGTESQKLDRLSEEIMGFVSFRAPELGIDIALGCMATNLAATKLLYHYSGGDAAKALQMAAIMSDSTIQTMGEIIGRKS